MWACAGVACPALPLLSPAGAWRFWLPGDFAAVVPDGVACLSCRLPTLSLVYFPAPYPPSPLPRWGRGRPRLFHARGFAPCIPGVEPGRHRSRGRIARWRGAAPPRLLASPLLSPAGWLAFFVACLPCLQFIFLPPIPPTPFPSGEGGDQGYFMQGAAPLASPGLNLRFAAKPTEFLYLEQCRQPRRGGTGGEELRRLRWSSPPGQVEQMPHGERSPAPPSGGTGAGAYRALEERLAPTFFFPCLDRRGGL